jgi:hypothetical protein
VQKFLNEGDCVLSHYENLCWKLQTWRRELNFDIFLMAVALHIWSCHIYMLQCSAHLVTTLHFIMVMLPFLSSNSGHLTSIMKVSRSSESLQKKIQNTIKIFKYNTAFLWHFSPRLGTYHFGPKTFGVLLILDDNSKWIVMEYGTMWNVLIWNTTATGYVNKNGTQHLGL